MADLYLKELFAKASQKLKYPAIKVEEQGKVVRFKLATKGYIGITVDDHYVGKIDQAGIRHIYEQKELVGDVLYKIDTQGPAYFTGQGKASGNCCFCGTAINSAESLVHGYGPICAQNFGLPWGDASKEEKQAMQEGAIKEAFSIDDLEKLAEGITGDEPQDGQDEELKRLERKEEKLNSVSESLDNLVQTAQLACLEELKVRYTTALAEKHLSQISYMAATRIVDQMIKEIKNV